jgi:ubiquinone/menaquinone biosynthesis C-methylase UbiE
MNQPYMENIKEHWEHIYQTRQPNEVSWTQEIPQTSLDFINSFHLPKTAKIIDIGGGDSKLVDYLLSEGFQDITVLDISEKALEKAKQRLGNYATKVKWVVQDILHFTPDIPFDLWHDRATFHFLTTQQQVSSYLSIIRQGIRKGGHAIIGTFSVNGPEQCSGLPIRQYDEEALQHELSTGFEKVKCITEDHITPFNTIQNFLFCSFKRA